MAKSLNRILLAAGESTSLPSVADAKRAWTNARITEGYSGHAVPHLLVNVGNVTAGREAVNAKVAKNPVPTYTLTLSPASTSKVANTCDKSTPQCRKACVMMTAGRGIMPSVRRGRNVRTQFAAEQPLHFLALLTHEVRSLERRGEPFGLRLNVGSDIMWEYVAPELFWGEHVRAYDYTKWGYADRGRPERYRLTFSHNERWSDRDVHVYVENGQNVAMVFDCAKHQLPDTWQGIPVIDGDLHDYRYDDPRGVIVGLAAKGAAKAMNPGGFVTSA